MIGAALLTPVSIAAMAQPGSQGFITGMNSAISVLAPHTAAPESNSDTARMMA